MKIKCSQCGCEEFVPFELMTKDYETGDDPVISTLTYVCNKKPIYPFNPSEPRYSEERTNAQVKAFACRKCGHIELFIEPMNAVYETAEILEKRIKNENDKKIKIAAIDKQISEIKNQILKQQEIINSEMSIVKDVNNAKTKLIELNNQLKKLENERLQTQRRQSI